MSLLKIIIMLQMESETRRKKRSEQSSPRAKSSRELVEVLRKAESKIQNLRFQLHHPFHKLLSWKYSPSLAPLRKREREAALKRTKGVRRIKMISEGIAAAEGLFLASEIVGESNEGAEV